MHGDGRGITFGPIVPSQPPFSHYYTKETNTCARSDINPLTPNDHYSGRAAPLTSKRCILFIYSTNIGTAYFKRGIYSPIFSPQMQFVS